MIKLKWKVEPPPTGRYKSFDKRGCPSADYPNGNCAINIYCDDPYIPSNVKEGKHSPLTVRIADYSKPSNPETGEGFTWRNLVQRFTTLKIAKEIAQTAINKYVSMRPKEYQEYQEPKETKETP